MNAGCVFLLVAILGNLKPSETRSVQINSNNKLFQNLIRFYFPKYKYNYNKISNKFPSLVNNDVKKPFVDLTKKDDDQFKMQTTDLSDDYIDFSDFVRNERDIPYVRDYIDYGYNVNPKPSVPDFNKHTNNLINAIKIISRRSVPIQKSRDLSDSEDSDAKSDSPEENSDESDKEELASGELTRDAESVPSINNSNDFYVDSDESIKPSAVSNEKYVYMQAPTRFVNANNVELRRRLKQFMPKRVHWNEDDFENLNTYWIAGPRGKYPDHYKTPY